MTHSHGSTITEMDLREARQVRDLLDVAIAGLQAGRGYTEDLDGLIKTLNHGYERGK